MHDGWARYLKLSSIRSYHSGPQRGDGWRHQAAGPDLEQTLSLEDLLVPAEDPFRNPALPYEFLVGR